MRTFRQMSFCVVFGICGVAAVSHGAQIILNSSSVIGGSGSYGGNPFNAGAFNALSVVDEQTGPVYDTYPQSGTHNNYWINSDDGPKNAYITIDLGMAYPLSQIELFNTSNSSFQDRGTGNFTINASNSVTDTGGGNFALTGATPIVSNTLSAQSFDTGHPTTPFTAQNFSVTDSMAYRYISFNPSSVASINPPCCGTDRSVVYGLAEIRVFSTPEPAGLSLLGLGSISMLTRRKRR